MDLFNRPNKWPSKLKAVLKKHAEKWQDTYLNCEALKRDLNKIGFTCEYYLDAIPYNLTKLKTKKT